MLHRRNSDKRDDHHHLTVYTQVTHSIQLQTQLFFPPSKKYKYVHGISAHIGNCEVENDRLLCIQPAILPAGLNVQDTMVNLIYFYFLLLTK